ncbi:MAG: CDP-diacylglycerol--serine O-phosphatidyltransferase [Ignavibacteria bacterium]
MRNPAKFIPSLFTVLNLFCGFLSVINASYNNLEQACLFIIYAALFDALDGVVARFSGTSSKFGVELDSLSDIVSFGLAPSFLLYVFYFYRLEGIGISIASLILIFSALRLARFNTQLVGLDKNFFVGLPVPVSAITVSSFFLFYFNKNFSPHLSEIFVYAVTFCLPLLMVSKFKYDTTPKFNSREVKKHPVKFIIVLLIIILIAFTKGEGLFAFCLFYMSTGIFRGFKNVVKKLFRKGGSEHTIEDSLKFKTPD